MRFEPTLLLALTATLLSTACGGGGGGGSGDPPQLPNEPPVLQAPSNLGGSGAVRTFSLSASGAAQLVFTASDPDGDPLLWQLQLSTVDAAAAGLGFQTPVAGSSFTLDLMPVATPAAVVARLLVEDPRGAAQAIDLHVVRSGAPVILGVAPDSAFASKAQNVTITGNALSLGGAVQTSVRFAGVSATATTAVDDHTLRCTTPTGATPGPTVVGVTHQFGSSQLPGTAFTMYSHPPVLAAADARLDGGAGTSFDVAREGPTVHLVWLEGSQVAHRSSTDGGATWTLPQTLSGGEVASEPRVAAIGGDVTVVWIADGNGVNARSSHDGGLSFAAVQPRDAAGGPRPRPRLAASAARRYVAWLRGNPGLGTARLAATASTDAGDMWRTAALVGGGGGNQYDHQVVGNGATAVIAFVDERQGASVPGIYTVRTTTSGSGWEAAQRRSLSNAAAGSPRLCNDASKMWLVWLRADVLEFMGSADAGLSWPTVASELRGGGQGAVAAPSLRCEGDRLYAIYVLAGTGVAVSRVGGIGTQPQHVTVSAVSGPAGEPQVDSRGNYVFAAWRDGDVAGGAARIVQTVSVDLGATFGNPVGFGDASTAQEVPRLLVDGARQLLLWLDHRSAPAGIYSNRTLQ